MSHTAAPVSSHFRRLVLAAGAVMLLALAFSAGLGISSFTKLYQKSLLQVHVEAGQNLKIEIERALRYGKSFEKYFGMNETLGDLARDNPDIANVIIADTQHKVLYALHSPGSPEARLPAELRVDFGKKTAPPQTSAELKGNYHILLPVCARDGQWRGTIDLSFPKQLVQDKMFGLLIACAKGLAVALAAAGVLLAVSLGRVLRRRAGSVLPRRAIFILIMLIAGGAQAGYAFFTVRHFEEDYLHTARLKSERLTKSVRTDIADVLRKGVQLDQLEKIELLLEHLVKSADEIAAISIAGPEQKIFYQASREGLVNPRTPSPRLYRSAAEAGVQEQLTVSLPLKEAQTDAAGLGAVVRVDLNGPFLAGVLNEIKLDALTVVIISFLFLSQILGFLFVVLEPGEPDRPRRSTSFDSVLPGAFLYLFAVSLSVPFLPVYIGQLWSRPNAGLMTAVVISAETLCTGIAIALGGAFTARHGWRAAFLRGSILTLVGLLGSAFAGDLWGFLGARCVLGCGYGLTWMSFQIFCTSAAGPQAKGRALALLGASVISGIICGGAAGGLLAERMGFGPVFFVAAGLAVLALGFGLMVLGREPVETEEPGSAGGTGLKLGALLKDPRLAGVIVLSAIPNAFCTVGFVNFLAPLYLKENRVSTSNTARILMLFGLVQVLLSPYVGQVVDRARRKSLFIVAGGVLGALGILAFWKFDSVWTMVLLVVLLGLATAISLSAQAVLAMHSPSAEAHGEGVALGLYRSLQRLGQGLGPIGLGAIIACVERGHAVLIVGSLYLAMTLVLWRVFRGEASETAN